jgi:hypothetical protein
MPNPVHELMDRRLSRRLAVAAAGVAGLAAFARPGQAQEEARQIGRPSGPAPIVSTRTGEVPSAGTRRPGPVDPTFAATTNRQPGLAPIGLQVDAALIDAPIEVLRVVDGIMQDPSGPWEVGWYENLAALGDGGNVVMAGHIDYWNVGPAVFYNIASLAEGDLVEVVAEDGQIFSYAVEWVREYPADNLPLDEVVGDTPTESVTLITCGGTFDYATAHYLSRIAVRANLVSS